MNYIQCVCVSELPFFTARPSAVYTVIPGRSVSMPCAADGEPQPAIAWRKVSHNNNYIVVVAVVVVVGLEVQ